MRVDIRQICRRSLFVVIILLQGCLVDVDNQEMIEEMQANKAELAELKDSLSERVDRGNDGIDNIQSGIHSIGLEFSELVKIMKRRDADFATMLDSTTSVTEKAITFLDSMSPEDIQNLARNFEAIVGPMNKMVNNLDSMDGEFDSLVNAIPEFASFLGRVSEVVDSLDTMEGRFDEIFATLPEFASFLGKAAQVLNQIDPEKTTEAMDAFFELSESLRAFNNNLLLDTDFQEDLKALTAAGVPAAEVMVRLNGVLEKMESAEFEEMMLNAQEILRAAGQARKTREGVSNFFKNIFGGSPDENSEKNENSIDGEG